MATWLCSQRGRLISRVVLLLTCLSAGRVLAAEEPLWELGIGVSALSFPDYRGSDESNLYLLPFPYVVYRGTFLRANKDGIRGALFDNNRIELNVSVGASVPVKSDHNRARQGMPDLQPTVEFGPALELHMWRSHDQRYKLDLRLPVRMGATVLGGVDGVGWELSPRVALDITDVAGLVGWNLGLLAGPMYGSKRSHEYFYSVPPRYVTADRPAFDAKAGYAGSQILVSVSKRYKKYWLGVFVRWDSLEGAVFADSPLVRRRSYLAAGVGIAWVIGKSSTLVEDAD